MFKNNQDWKISSQDYLGIGCKVQRLDNNNQTGYVIHECLGTLCNKVCDIVRATLKKVEVRIKNLTITKLKHELILEGRLGSILGMEIITDGYRYPTLQVLQPGEVFVTAAPVTLGSIVQRKELDSRAVDFYNQGRAARGWFLEQIQGQVLGNGRAVSRGGRV